MARRKKWAKRRTPNYRTKPEHSQWVDVTEKQKEKLEKLNAKAYEFKLNKEPELTPNSESKEENQD